MNCTDLGSRIYEVVLEGIKHRVEYGSFVHVVIRAEGYNIAHLNFLQKQLADKLSALIELVERCRQFSSNFEEIISQKVQELTKGQYVKYLVDNLGLPEIYGLFWQLSNKYHRNINLAEIRAVINPRGNTAEFKNAVGEETMRKIAERYGLQLIKGLDEKVHQMFNNPMRTELLIRSMEENLLRHAINILEHDLKREMKLLIIADHGYDIECEGEMCRLCHGTECKKQKLSLIIPLIVIY